VTISQTWYPKARQRLLSFGDLFLGTSPVLVTKAASSRIGITKERVRILSNLNSEEDLVELKLRPFKQDVAWLQLDYMGSGESNLHLILQVLEKLDSAVAQERAANAQMEKQSY
jgi:hypothetical protein